MIKYIAVGVAAVAGAALLEAALVPALAIGVAVVAAPAVLPRLRRQVQPAIDALIGPLVQPAPTQPTYAQSDQPVDEAPPTLIERLGIKQALVKTVTFRVIVTSLDFTTNFIVLGELTTAAGLSTINLVGGPIFYFVHETVWNHLRPARDDIVEVPALSAPPSDGEQTTEDQDGWRLSRPLAKTITFRTFATAMDFTTNFVVVGDVVTAVGLSAAGFVLGPFVYWGHEKAWDHFSAPKQRTVEPSPRAKLAPTIGSDERVLV
jgi:uncharacterized membrane protein